MTEWCCVRTAACSSHQQTLDCIETAASFLVGVHGPQNGYQIEHKEHTTRATTEVYHFLAILFSEPRGSLTQNRREKNCHFFHGSRRVPRPMEFASGSSFTFLKISSRLGF